MTYLSDWYEWVKQSQKAHEAHPDCTGKADCPAESHVHECVAYRKERRHRVEVSDE